MATCCSETLFRAPTPIVAWISTPRWLALVATAALLGLTQPEFLIYDTGMPARDAGRYFPIHKESLQTHMDVALEAAQGRRN